MLLENEVFHFNYSNGEKSFQGSGRQGFISIKNPYGTLKNYEYSESTDIKQIQEDFRVFLRINHPNSFNPAKIDYNKYQEMNAAFKILTDENKRRALHIAIEQKRLELQRQRANQGYSESESRSTQTPFNTAQTKSPFKPTPAKPEVRTYQDFQRLLEIIKTAKNKNTLSKITDEMLHGYVKALSDHLVDALQRKYFDIYKNAILGSNDIRALRQTSELHNKFEKQNRLTKKQFDTLIELIQQQIFSLLHDEITKVATYQRLQNKKPFIAGIYEDGLLSLAQLQKLLALIESREIIVPR